ncbi:hypothetical protein TrST_g2472 [Triparma strigata]|uniref:WW domain-containing protein n=1 Tax=Triparma strigata TaxID=1606541 RepID=A0A9W7AAM5_9STRA|nr:hypothetical protein TrST_g2472 [Triparma strigata]
MFRALILLFALAALATAQNLRVPDEAAFLEQFASGLPNPEAPHDPTKFVNHDLLLRAVRNGAKLGYVSYDVDLHDDFQYVLEMEVDVHDNVKILDDHHSELHSFVHSDGSQMVFNDLPSGWKVGDHIIGSHDGRWNEIVDFDHPLGYGVTLSRKIEKMQKDRSSGKTTVVTSMANPQQAVTRSGMKLNLNFTEPIRDLEKFSRRLDEDQDLKKWCEEACEERIFYQKAADPDLPQEMEVDICYKCFDVTKAHLEFVKFNYNVATQEPLYPEFKIGNGEGIVCRDCYAYLGTRIEFELEYTSLYLKRFKLMYGGNIGFNYNITIDDPTFPPFWESNYEKFPEEEGPGALKITPNTMIPIGPPKPMPPPAPPLPCNDMSPIYTPTGALNALGLRFVDTCTIWLEFEGDFGIQLMGLGSAKGHTAYSFGLGGDLALGVEYTKFGPMENGKWRFATWEGHYSPPKTADYSNFKTNGISVEMTFLPLIRMGVSGGTFPFNMLHLTSELEFAPYVGYEAHPGQDTGTFSITVINDDSTKDGSEANPYLGGDKLKIRIDYSDYEREDAVFLAIRNDCWERSADHEPVEFLPLMSQRATFSGSGSIEMEWTVAYNDLFSTKQLETGGFMCGLFPQTAADDEYGGILCTDWLTKCEKHEWRIYPKLATQPFMDIAPSNHFALFVNDLDDHRGIGIIAPKDKDEGKGGEEFTFKWDHEGFTQYAGNTEISGAVPLESVDIKLYYLSECLVPGTFIGCNENWVSVTEPNVGTPNDGEETFILEECTSNGHKLSDAGGLAGASVFAVVQGIENTNVISRMDGEFYVKEADKCGDDELQDISFSFGESFLKTTNDLGSDNLQIGVHMVQTWWKEETERFTNEHDFGVVEDGQGGFVNKGIFHWNDTLPFKGECPRTCMKIEITQGGAMGGNCVIWGGSVDMFKKTMRQGQWETLLIDIDNCDFIAGMDQETPAAGEADSETNKYPVKVMPAYVQVMWEDGITCPPGEALDDNWFLMEKFFEKDSCKVCPPNEYSETKSEFCEKCPDGTVADSLVAAGHDSLEDCKACSKGKFYHREIDVSVSFEGAEVWTPYYCEVCPIDTYSEQLGATECTTCPYGKAIRNQPTAAGHFSSKQCVKLCDNSHFFVEAGLYCLKKKWGMCTGGFGYSAESWCERCSKCDTSTCEAECAGARRLDSVDLAFTLEEDEAFNALIAEAEQAAREKEDFEAAIEAKKAAAQRLNSLPPAPQAPAISPPKAPFKVPEDQRVYLNKPASMLERHASSVEKGDVEVDEERALTSTESTCDEYYWGIGMKGGITRFKIVNPGGGLHKNMFEIDLYSDEDGQLDFALLGPFLTDKHFYNYCDAMEAPTWDTGITCDKGSYSDAGNGLGPCTVCGKNSYSDSTGENSCTSCPDGKYIEDDKQVDITFHDSADDCVDMSCPPGRYLSTSAQGGNAFDLSSCLLCGVGTYKPGAGAEACTSCEAGKYQNQQGSIACTDCTMGSYNANPGSGSCDKCGAGKWSNEIGSVSADACVNCEAGLYSDATGATDISTCTQCPAGTKSDVVGATSVSTCTQCTAGYFARRTGSTACDACPMGSYSGAVGATSCESCGYGKYSETEISTSDSDCLQCPAGKYAGSLGSTSCSTCTEPMTVNEEKSECLEDTDFDESDIDNGGGGNNDGGGGGGGDGGDGQQQQTPSPTAAPMNPPHDKIGHECAATCPEVFFEDCDASFLKNECSEDCDAQLLYVYKAFFEQLCPENFQPPPIGFINIDSGFLIDDLSKADIEDENDELFLISVLQHGIAKQIAGVEFYDILISKIADKFIDWAENADAGMYDIGGNERRKSRSRSRSRRLDGDGEADANSVHIEFTINAPAANVADARSEDIPDIQSTSGQSQAQELSRAVWLDLEEDLETKNIVTEGLAVIDPHDQATTKLAQSLKSGASVNKNTLESPTLEVVVVGAPEPESDEDTDDSLFGKTGEFALIGIAAAGLVIIVIGAVIIKRNHDFNKMARAHHKKPVPRKVRAPTTQSVELLSVNAGAGGVGTTGGIRDKDNDNEWLTFGRTNSTNYEGNGGRESRSSSSSSFASMAQTMKKQISFAVAPPKIPPPPEVADPWDAVYDKVQQKYYFYNHDNGATQWDHP